MNVVVNSTAFCIARVSLAFESFVLYSHLQRFTTIFIKVVRMCKGQSKKKL